MITWTESYEMGIAKVDEQHRSLVAKINELHAAMKAGKGRENLAPILGFLKQYAVEHFDTEEKLMKTYDYPEYQAHKKEHDDFKVDFIKLAEELEANPHAFRVIVDVQRRLSDWLVNHLKVTDRNTMAYLVSKGAK